MVDTTEDKIAKVRTLYERTTNPGEKAAAYEALKRLLGIGQDNPSPNSNWLEEMKALLVSKGFYFCCATGNSHLYSKINQKVWLNQTAFNRGNWEFYQSSFGRKRAYTDRSPDKTGNTKDQLIKLIK